MKLKQVITISVKSSAAMKSQLNTELQRVIKSSAPTDQIVVCKVDNNNIPFVSYVNRNNSIDDIVSSSVASLGHVRNGANALLMVYVLSPEPTANNLVCRYDYSGVNAELSKIAPDEPSNESGQDDVDFELALQRDSIETLSNVISKSFTDYDKYIDDSKQHYYRTTSRALKELIDAVDADSKIHLAKRDILRFFDTMNFTSLTNFRGVYGVMQLMMENLDEMSDAIINVNKKRCAEIDARISSIESAIRDIKASMSVENASDTNVPNNEATDISTSAAIEAADAKKTVAKKSTKRVRRANDHKDDIIGEVNDSIDNAEGNVKE